MEWFLKNLGKGQKWPSVLPRTLFTTPSAAATFGYGAIPMRFKIKAGIKFKLLVTPEASTCESYLALGLIRKSEISNTVIVRLDNLGAGTSILEYSLCSADPIESWSYGMKEHYDEILRDHNWMTTQNYYYWEGYSKSNGVDDYIGNTIDNTLEANRTNFSMNSFTRRMTFLKALTASGVGQVLSPKNATEVSVRNHFKTAKPIYFNPD